LYQIILKAVLSEDDKCFLSWKLLSLCTYLQLMTYDLEKHRESSPTLHMLPLDNARLTTSTNPKAQLQMREQKSQEKHRESSPTLHMLPPDNARLTTSTNQLQTREQKSQEKHSESSPTLYMLPPDNALLTKATNPETQLQIRAQKNHWKNIGSPPQLYICNLSDNHPVVKITNAKPYFKKQGCPNIKNRRLSVAGKWSMQPELIRQKICLRSQGIT